MFNVLSNSATTGEIVAVCIAFALGVLGAWGICRMRENLTPRTIAVFTYCYAIWLVMGPNGLTWRHPEITAWFLIEVSALYLPILIGLVVRYFVQKSGRH